jgi:hypothetical protein
MFTLNSSLRKSEACHRAASRVAISVTLALAGQNAAQARCNSVKDYSTSDIAGVAAQ